MSNIRRNGAAALAVLLFVSSLSLAQKSASVVSPQDDAAVRNIITGYFTFYANKDSDGLVALWDPASPGLAARKREIDKLFASTGKTLLKSLVIRKLEADGNRAFALVALEITPSDPKEAQPAMSVGPTNRILRFSHGDRGWHVQQDILAEDEVASEIVAATSDEARGQILEDRRDLVDRTLWELLSARARALFQTADYSASLAVLQVNRQIAEQLGDKVLISRTLNNTGIIYQWRGDYPKALDHFKKSLDLAESLGTKAVAAAAMSNIASVYSQEGDFQASLEYGYKALALNESIGARKAAGDNLLSIGDAYYFRGDNRKALQSYQHSLGNYEAIGDQFSVARALGSLGNVHRSQGNSPQALEYYRKSLPLSEAAGDKVAVATTLGNLGAVLQEQADYPQAVEYFKKSLSAYQAVGVKSGEANALSALAEVNLRQRNYGEALEYYGKSLAIYEGIGDKQGQGVALDGMATVYLAQASPQKALELAARAAELDKQTGSIESGWRAQTGIGRAFRALGQYDQAQAALETAIAGIEDLRTNVAGGEQESERFFEKRTEPYYEMIRLLVAQGRTRDAFGYAERVRARVLLDVLRRGRIDIAKAMTVQERDQERRLTEALYTLNRQIYRERSRPSPDAGLLGRLGESLRKARLEHEAFQTTLYSSHPDLKLRRGEGEPITTEGASSILTSSRSAALEFVVTEQTTFMFVLTASDQHTESAIEIGIYAIEVSRKELSDRIQLLWQRLANHDNGFEELSTSLYELLLRPADSLLKNKSLLVIVPDGPLWNLPFQTLESAAGRYLIESSAISYAPSLTVLAEMIRRRNSTQPPGSRTPSVLALGNPFIGKETAERVRTTAADASLEPLPEAERQVKAIASLFGASRARAYVGADAREDLLKAEAANYDILHLATHGVLDNASPMYSHLVLSQTPGKSAEDGLLEAWEIMNLDLKADLAVLSACETGRGRIGDGEGVIGLAWAFFVAGCPTTVVSQWKVESTSTTELMLQFYNSLKSGMDNPTSRTTKAEALRQAALKLIRSQHYKHPFYWGGFVIVGNPL